MKFIAALLFIGIAEAQDPAAQIRASRQRSNQALARQDIKTFGESLAEDYVLVRGNGVFVGSRAASMESLAADFSSPDAVRYARTPDKIEVSSVAPIAAEHGHWTATLPNGKVAYTGTYLAMWRRGESGWLIRSEMFVLLGCEDEAVCAEYKQKAQKR